MRLCVEPQMSFSGLKYSKHGQFRLCAMQNSEYKLMCIYLDLYSHHYFDGEPLGVEEDEGYRAY